MRITTGFHSNLKCKCGEWDEVEEKKNVNIDNHVRVTFVLLLRPLWHLVL